MLRIFAGQFKGFSIKTPKEIRPTSSKVRQAVFNILAGMMEGSRFLDGFAGSGAYGIEALSRGASYVAFIDNDTESILSIRDNLGKLAHDLPRQAWRVLHADIETGLRHLAKEEQKFDIIVLDSPYGSEELKKALNAVEAYAMLAPTGIMCVEHDRRTQLPGSLGPLHRQRQHRYGGTVLSFYRHTPPQA